MEHKNSFSKQERICARSSVSELFEKGESLFSFPCKCVYQINDTSEELSSQGIVVRIMVSVGKRYHKRAVRRNRVKRLIREAYRLNKGYARELLAPYLEGKVLTICYIYTSKQEENYKTVENGVRKSFEKVEAVFKKNCDSNSFIADSVL
ncbi:MAG: ribonuclease P protein component, partial [Rikenellaceae bacterium]